MPLAPKNKYSDHKIWIAIISSIVFIVIVAIIIMISSFIPVKTDKIDMPYDKFDVSEVSSINILYEFSGVNDKHIELNIDEDNKEIKKIISLLKNKSTLFEEDVDIAWMKSMFIVADGWIYSFSYDVDYIKFTGEPLSSHYDPNRKDITIKNDELIEYLNKVFAEKYQLLANPNNVKPKPTKAVDYSEKIDYLVDEICSSPLEASSPYAYINMHKHEYNEIVNMGFDAIDPIIKIIESDGLTLTHHIAYRLGVSIMENLYAEELPIAQMEMIEHLEVALVNWGKGNQSMLFYEVPSKGGNPSLFVWKDHLSDNDNFKYTLAGVFNIGIFLPQVYYSPLVTDNVDFVRYLLEKQDTDKDIYLSQIIEDEIDEIELMWIAENLGNDNIKVESGMFENINGFTNAKDVNEIIDVPLYKINSIKVMHIGNETLIIDQKLIMDILKQVDMLRLEEQNNQEDSTGYDYYFDLQIDNKKIVRFMTYGDDSNVIDIDGTRYDVINMYVYIALKNMIKDKAIIVD